MKNTVKPVVGMDVEVGNDGREAALKCKVSVVHEDKQTFHLDHECAPITCVPRPFAELVRVGDTVIWNHD